MKSNPAVLLCGMMLGITLSLVPVTFGLAASEGSSDLVREAQVLAQREARLFEARQKSDWKALHGLQHPEFQKKISVDEIRFFEGWVTSDYREQAAKKSHISGAAVPSLDFIKKNPHKMDPLGFPVQRRYIWSRDPYVQIKTYSLEKISISRNGKYARVRILAQGRQRLNPAIIRGDIQFDAHYPLTDYWEKVDGNWVITLLARPVNFSGAGKMIYFLPNNSSDWEKMEFVEFDPQDLNLS